MTLDAFQLTNLNPMKNKETFDVIIIGGSYSGLAAGMSLGRALRKVLIIDDGKPANRQTPHSHNFLTQDGKTPREIATLARHQVERYGTVTFYTGQAIKGGKTGNGFVIQVASGDTFTSRKLIFATGIRDIMQDLDGYAACWGISVLHCPYCHGYEVRNQKTGILGNGDLAFEFAMLIANWTADLTLFTNGKSTLASQQQSKLKAHHIRVIEAEIEKLEHTGGTLQNILFKDGTRRPLKALYARSPFEQSTNIPQSLGCALTDEGYLKVDHLQKTNVHGVFACGDSTTPMRTVANAVAMGTTAGMMVNKEILMEGF